jgi:dTDP-4-amino-4,6-dideoxygalactose transaminase
LTHYNGNSVDFEELNKIIIKKNICIIEDAAQAYGSKYKNQYLGTIGDFGCFSYHQTKNIHCGTGGALLINNLKYDKIATIIWNRGTNRSDFFKGNASKYVWINKGSTAYLSEIQAAFLYSQIESFNKVQKFRKFIFDRYIKQLKKIKDKIILPSINNYNISNYHLFYILLPEIKSRPNFIKFMKDHKIEVTSHYEALHLSPMIRNKLKIKIKLPLSEELSKKIVRLPMHMNLKTNDIDYISSLTKKFILKS